MLRELRVSELRYRAMLEVLDGAVISTVAAAMGCLARPCTPGCAGMRARVRC
jgi:hypothetical protein